MSELEERIELTTEEAWVLGCLLEKAAKTPDVYPLTLNSLISACNQKTNRNPVVDYDEECVAEAIEGTHFLDISRPALNVLSALGGLTQ